MGSGSIRLFLPPVLFSIHFCVTLNIFKVSLVFVWSSNAFCSYLNTNFSYELYQSLL